MGQEIPGNFLYLNVREMFCNLHFLHWRLDILSLRPTDGNIYGLKTERADLLMTLTGSSGAAPGLTADTPGAPPGTSCPACPGAGSLGVVAGPPHWVRPGEQPGDSHPGTLQLTTEVWQNNVRQ